MARDTNQCHSRLQLQSRFTTAYLSNRIVRLCTDPRRGTCLCLWKHQTLVLGQGDLPRDPRTNAEVQKGKKGEHQINVRHARTIKHVVGMTLRLCIHIIIINNRASPFHSFTTPQLRRRRVSFEPVNDLRSFKCQLHFLALAITCLAR